MRTEKLNENIYVDKTLCMEHKTIIILPKAGIYIYLRATLLKQLQVHCLAILKVHPNGRTLAVRVSDHDTFILPKMKQILFTDNDN